MDPLIGGALISAGSNLLGGFLGERGADARNEANLAFAQKQLEMQREFAQNGIRWKVADAQAAGIHPLFAMGAPPFNPSPVSLDFQEPGFGMAQALAQTGQDIGRAIHATRTNDDRMAALLQSLEVERAGLQNDLLRSQIARMNSAQVGPALPGYSPPSGLPGISNGGAAPVVPVEVKPLELNASDPANPAKEAGFVSDYGFTRTPTGLAVVPSKDVKDRIEDQIFPELMWGFRNTLMPNFSDVHKPDVRLFDSFNGRPVVDWKWNYARQEWQPVYFEGR